LNINIPKDPVDKDYWQLSATFVFIFCFGIVAMLFAAFSVFCKG